MTEKTKKTLLSIVQMDQSATEQEIEALKSALGMSDKSHQVSKLLTITEVCDLLRVKRNTIWRWTQSGKLKPIYLNNTKKSIRYKSADLDALYN